MQSVATELTYFKVILCHKAVHATEAEPKSGPSTEYGRRT